VQNNYILDEIGRIRRTRACEIKPGSTEVLDKIRMIFRLQGNAAPRPKAAGGLASCLQGMMNTEEAEEQQKEKRRRRSKGWKRGKKWMI